ncbi:MAG: MFS transporter [Lachnospiraceae bacterium]|nr:MFS transporter [Lachnospiraceae bacterium]
MDNSVSIMNPSLYRQYLNAKIPIISFTSQDSGLWSKLYSGTGTWETLGPSRKLFDCPANRRKYEKIKSYLTFLQILKAPMLIPLCLLNMIYMGGHQNIFANWFQLFLQTVDPVRYPESFTSFCMTVYWIGMLGSRLLSAYLADKIAPRRFILCGSFVGVLAQILGLACNQPLIWLLACALLGLCTGAVFPLTFAIAITWFPKNSARISSLIGIGTSIGGALISLITGRIAEGSFTLAMLVPVCSLAGVFLLMRFRFPRETA